MTSPDNAFMIDPSHKLTLRLEVEYDLDRKTIEEHGNDPLAATVAVFSDMILEEGVSWIMHIDDHRSGARHRVEMQNGEYLGELPE